MGASDTPEVSKAIPFNPKNVPTQTKVVDMMIQAVRVSKPGCGIRRIALIVSAWDLVKDQCASPAAWLEENMPLLQQFLDTNSDQFETRLYGVSAQGVELNPQNQDEYKKNRSEILSLASASDRIAVVDGDSTTNNISAPLRWLMQQ
jgi:hypothetical protein